MTATFKIERGLTFRPSIAHIAGNAAAEYYYFEVVDTGIGVPKADQERVMEPFVQVNFCILSLDVLLTKVFSLEIPFKQPSSEINLNDYQVH